MKQFRAVRLVLWLANAALIILIMESGWSAPKAEVKMHNSDQGQGGGATGESVTPSDKPSEPDRTGTEHPLKSIHPPGTPVSPEELQRLKEEAERTDRSPSSGGQSDQGGAKPRR